VCVCVCVCVCVYVCVCVCVCQIFVISRENFITYIYRAGATGILFFEVVLLLLEPETIK
jgi:hypothetical protein